MNSQTQSQTQQLHSSATSPTRRPKYRDEDFQNGLPSNIMFDRRVVRGNTYAAQILPAEPLTLETNTLKKKGSSTRRVPPRTPEPVEGRRHTNVQTDTYLEELTDVVPEAETATQTDAFLDRPPTPLFVPQKTGTDATTQIENGDLFDFDFEVEPILEVLVGKVLEQGLMEVLEEEELAAMRAHQEHFEQLRNAELVAVQRMEAAERRKAEEKDRRLAQERERIERERVLRQKVAAATFARGYLNGIVNTVFDRLTANGYFYDTVQCQVEDEFLPWMRQQSAHHLADNLVARQVVRALVAHTVVARAESRSAAEMALAAAREAALRHQQEQEAAAAAALAAEMDAMSKRASFILGPLQPPPVGLTPEVVAEARQLLAEKAEADADALWEQEKGRAVEAAREAAEAQAAEDRAQYDAAVAEAQEAGGEAPTEPAPLDLAALGEEAAALVQRPQPVEATDQDVLSHLLEKGTLTKEAIVQALALHFMGPASFANNRLFA